MAVIPLASGRTDFAGANVFHQASVWGSILQPVWSFMLALRARGLGSAWTTGHLWREKEVAELLGVPHRRYMQAGLFPVAYTVGTAFKRAYGRPAASRTGCFSIARKTGRPSNVATLAQAMLDSFSGKVPRFGPKTAEICGRKSPREPKCQAVIIDSINGRQRLPPSAGGSFSVQQLAEAGVRRISLGSSLARAALGAMMRAAREIKLEGTFGFAAQAIPFAEINRQMRPKGA